QHIVGARLPACGQQRPVEGEAVAGQDQPPLLAARPGVLGVAQRCAVRDGEGYLRMDLPDRRRAARQPPLHLEDLLPQAVGLLADTRAGQPHRAAARAARTGVTNTELASRPSTARAARSASRTP